MTGGSLVTALDHTEHGTNVWHNANGGTNDHHGKQYFWYDQHVKTPKTIELEQTIEILKQKAERLEQKTERQATQITRLEQSRRSLREHLKRLNQEEKVNTFRISDATGEQWVVEASSYDIIDGYLRLWKRDDSGDWNHEDLGPSILVFQAAPGAWSTILRLYVPDQPVAQM